MATLAQIDANRVNAQLSTGPNTEPGKAASSQNARAHCLTGQTLHVPQGRMEEFNRLEFQFRCEIRPQGATEETHFTDFIRHRWNLTIACELIAQLEAQSPVHPLLDPEKAKTFERFEKYRRQHEYAAGKCLRELSKLQNDRIFREAVLEEEAGDVSPLVDVAKVRTRLHRDKKQIASAGLAGLEAYINAPIPTARE